MLGYAYGPPRTRATARKTSGRNIPTKKPGPIILHQIPCWAELCQLLSQMTDKEINDILSTSLPHGTTILWDDSAETECGSVGMADPSKSPTDEPFSIALKQIHQNKLTGQYDARDFTVKVQCGGKYGKFWQLETNINKPFSYTVTSGKLYRGHPVDGYDIRTVACTSADECYKEAVQTLSAKGHNMNLDWDRLDKYQNDYLNVAMQMDDGIKTWQVKQKQFAQNIQHAVNGLFPDDVCNMIAVFCNEDRLDHYHCDAVFDPMVMSCTPIGRLMEDVHDTTDPTPDIWNMHLCSGIYGHGQRVGHDVCHGSIRVFSPREMKAFAKRMVKRLMKANDNEKAMIFGDLIRQPPLKKRKLNNTNPERVTHDLLYKVACALSGSAIFEPRKQDIIWRYIFMLNKKHASKVAGTDAGNHSLSVLCFGLNAAAMKRGAIAHYDYFSIE
eukprot:351927_1